MRTPERSGGPSCCLAHVWTPYTPLVRAVPLPYPPEPRRAASSNPSTVALGRRSPSVSPPHSASAGGSTTSPCRSSTSSTRSTTPSPRSTWMDGYSDGGNDDAYGDDGGYGDNIPTRDFLSRPATFSSAAPYNPNAFGMPSSSSLNPSRLDFGGLDLNSGSDWAAMLGYEDLLRSGGVDGSHGPPPVRVPGRSGRGTLGLRGARGGRGRGGSASAGSGSAFAGGFVSPTPTGRGASSRGTRGGRRRGGRRRVGEDNNRCHWTPEHTKLFCVLYCEQIDNGNCTRGHMSKAGWKEISERFYAATDLLHDSEQFGSRYRGLKKVWRFIDEKLRKGSGLGRREDQSVLASDAWWTDKTGGNKELMALKDGWPCYLEEMDKMFTGYVADGSTSYAPGQSNPIEHIVSDEDEEAEEEEDEDDVLTPLSIGSKRSSSSRSTHSLRSTATSPKKKLKSPAVKAMVGEIRGMRNEIADGRVFYQGVVNCRRAEREAAREAAKQEEKEKLKQEEERRQLIMRLARECGVNESSPTWIGVLKLMKDETGISFFFASDNVGKRTTIEYYARADVAASTVADDSDDEEEYGEADDSDDEFDRLLLANLMQEEAAAAAAMYGMSAVAMHLDKYCNRSEFREVGPGLSGLEWVERKLGNPTACYKMFRMTPTMFYRLHDMLCNNYGLQSSEKSSSIEALGMFLWMVGAPQSVRQAEDRFERSLGTVHSFFYKVLNCLRRLADDIIKPRDPQFRTMHTRLDNPRFYPFFKDCIGAIDGTHIPCVVSKDLVVQYMCRKNITTQNVMACCDFDLIFTFVLAGWPGSVHDMRVFNDAMNKYTDVFPHPPPGKYYLVDSGYANRPGYLAPYRGTKYHLQEYQNAEEPQGKEELFNYAHSSLRNCIERSFGVLKQKWRILMHLPSYPIETQTHIIVACMALHNFIRLSGLRDRHFGRCDRDPRYVPSVASVDQPPTEQAPTILDSRQMNEFRDSIALQMLEGSL